ncbi:hypothetical protein AB0D47_31480 [Streptomyces sp. NPDC048376]|uniref:hypothetical protein n=1 Tax=unclassified Streptomyces TaxID=2593676 RepID=UPI00343F739B
MSMPLVARDQDGQLVGALLTVPSATIAETASRLPDDSTYDLVSILKAIAVYEDARGAGVHAALLKRCVQIYWQLDYHSVFGQFEMQCALGPYQAREVFSVLEPPQTIDVGTVLAGHPMRLGVHPGEALFYHGDEDPHLSCRHADKPTPSKAEAGSYRLAHRGAFRSAQHGLAENGKQLPGRGHAAQPAPLWA